MSGICPKCGRDYSSKSTVCRFCNCALIDRKSYNTPVQPQKQSTPQSGQQINEHTSPNPGPVSQMPPKNITITRSTPNRKIKKKNTSFITLAISIFLCITIISTFFSSKKDNNTGNKENTETINNVYHEIDNELLENPTPETVQTIIENVIGKDKLKLFTYVPENNYCFIKFQAVENLTTKLTISGMYIDMFNIIKALQPIIDADIIFKVDITLYDTYGNPIDDTVIEATFYKDTVQKINFEYAYSDNLPNMADKWWVHDVLKISE